MRPRKRYKVGYNEQIKDNAKSAYLIKESLNKGTLKPPSDAMVDPSGNPYVFALPAAIVGEEYTRDEQGRITFSSPLQRSNYFYNRNLGEEGISQAREMEASVREGTTNAVQGALQAYAAFSEPLGYLQKALVTAPLAQAMGKLDEVNLNPVAMLSGQDPGISSPSEALGIENPIGAFAVDALTDPLNFAGAGLLSAIRKQRMKDADIPFDLPEGVGGGGPPRNLPSGDGGTPKKKPNRYLPAPLGDNAFVPKSLMDQGILAKQARPDGTLPASAFANTMNSDNLSAGDKTYIRRALELTPEAVNNKGDVNLDLLRVAVHNLYNPKVTTTEKFANYNIEAIRSPERGSITFDGLEAVDTNDADQVLVELKNSGINIDEDVYDNVVYPLTRWGNKNLVFGDDLTGNKLKPLSDYIDPFSLVEKTTSHMMESVFSKPLTDKNGRKLPDNLQTTLGPFIKFEYGEFVPNFSGNYESEIFPILSEVADHEQKKVIINEFAKSANDMSYITERISEYDPEEFSQVISQLDEDLFSPENSQSLKEAVIESHPILSITENLDFDFDNAFLGRLILKKLEDIDNPGSRANFRKLFDDDDINYEDIPNAYLKEESYNFGNFLNFLMDDQSDSKETKVFNAKQNAINSSRSRLETAISRLNDYYYGLDHIQKLRTELGRQVEGLSTNAYLPGGVKKEIISFLLGTSSNPFDQDNLITLDINSEQIKYYENPLAYFTLEKRPIEHIAEYLTARNGRNIMNDNDVYSFIDFLSKLGLKIPDGLEDLHFQIANEVKNVAITLSNIERYFENSMLGLNELFLASSNNSFLNAEVSPTKLSKSLNYITYMSETAKALKNVKQRKLSQRNKALQSLVEKGKDPSKINVGRTVFLLSANSMLTESGFRGPKQSDVFNDELQMFMHEGTHWKGTESPEAWGHIRVNVDLEYPEVLQVHESQSDLFQTGKRYVEMGINRPRSEFNEFEAPFLKQLKDVETYQRTQLYKSIQIAINNGQTQIAYPTKETATIIQGYKTQEDWRDELDFDERIRKASTPVYHLKSKDNTFDEVESASRENIRERYETQARFAAKELNVTLRKERMRGYYYYVFDIPEKFLKREAEMPTFEKGGKFKINKIVPKKFLRAMKKK